MLFVCLAAFGAASAGAAPARAQSDADAVLKAMVACSAIVDVPARVACYDGTIPGARVALQNPPAAQARAEAASTRTVPASDFAELRATVAAVTQVRDGIYAVALADGSEWRFIEGVPLYFTPPRKGTEVKLERGALGSYRMLIPGQRAVRVSRTR